MNDVIALSISDLPELVNRMKNALKFDSTLSPSSFDTNNASEVASVAIKWQLQMTPRAREGPVST